MRSYILLAFYSIVALAFFKWEASIFLLMMSLLVEMLILTLGLLMTNHLRKNKGNRNDVTGFKMAGGALPMIGLYYFITRLLASHYGEFSDGPHGWIQPFYDYPWAILIIAVSLGGSYFVDIRSLKSESRFEKITIELVRTMIIIYGISLIGSIVVMVDPSISKWIPISIMIVSRMLIEIWYLKQSDKSKNKVS